MTYGEAIDQLTREGNFRVPCSRYGADTLECADVAYRAMQAYLADASADDQAELLEYLMVLVVNDSDDIAYLLADALADKCDHDPQLKGRECIYDQCPRRGEGPAIYDQFPRRDEGPDIYNRTFL